MKRQVLFVIMMGLLSAPCVGEYSHTKTGFVFPDKIGDMELGKVANFEEDSPGGGSWLVLSWNRRKSGHLHIR